MIEALSRCPDELSSEGCPFSKLHFVKINKSPPDHNLAMVVPDPVKNFLLENNRNAKILIYPVVQVAQARSILKRMLNVLLKRRRDAQ